MTDRSSAHLAPEPRLARLTVDQYHRMRETHILRDGEPIELLDGLLVHKERGTRGSDPMTVGPRHAMAIRLLAEQDPAVRAAGWFMLTQLPVSLPPYHEPEPDGAIVRGAPRDYPDRPPGAADVAIVIEVADSSLETDRTRKLSIYASAGIPQYVIVNLVDRQLEVHEQPVPAEGRYASQVTLHTGDLLHLRVGAQRLPIPVGHLLP